VTQLEDRESDLATGRGFFGSVWFPALVLVLTVAQLAVAEYVPGIDRFADKAFGARLIAYPVMMLFVPAVWWLVQRRQGRSDRPPYLAFGLIGVPFLIDVTGNSLDLYDSVVWWDDFNHFVNWVFLCLGLALVIVPRLRPAWVLVTLVTGFGCILALGWELGEWYTFIRHGTELDTAYEDTLGDMTLGTLGSLVAGLLVLRLGRSTGRVPETAL
jgi:hypothetical protein